MTPPKLHKAPEAGRIVGKSPSWMYQKGAAGEIPRTKIGHHVGWTDEQLAQIIRDAAQQPTARETQNTTREAKKATKAEQPEARAEQKPRPAPPANTRNIPQADRSVSRLYRDQEAS